MTATEMAAFGQMGIVGRGLGGGGGYRRGGSSREAQIAATSAFGVVKPGASSDKANRLAKMFETPVDIMFAGDFDQAREVAKGTRKWLLVTITDLHEFACEALKRDLWNKPEVKECIKANFLFMMMGSETPDGLKHKNFYPFDSYPYFAIIDPRTGERVRSWNKALTPDEFFTEVGDFLDGAGLGGDDAGYAKKRPSAGSGPLRPRPKVSEMSEEEQLELALRESMGGVAEEGASGAGPDAMEEEDVVVVEERKPANDGSRDVRKFLKTTPVRTLFEYMKTKVDQPFELRIVSQPLLGKIDETLAEANVINASLNVEIIDAEGD
ncbi:hypothetical protein HK101_009563 [Irineochytrium annulatum]|nr:hypothetical protein HK101_009563 [Irineochytrium annulatum]